MTKATAKTMITETEKDWLDDWSDDQVFSSNRGPVWWKAHGTEVDEALKIINPAFGGDNIEFCRWRIECALAQFESFGDQWRQRRTPVTKQTKSVSERLFRALERVDKILEKAINLDITFRQGRHRAVLGNLKLRAYEAATAKIGSRKGLSLRDASVRRAAIFLAYDLMEEFAKGPNAEMTKRLVKLARLLGASGTKGEAIWLKQNGMEIDIGRMCKNFISMKK